MADDETDHSKLTAKPGMAPDERQETPASSTELQPDSKPDGAETNSQGEFTAAAAQHVEAGSPEAQSRSEGQILGQIPGDAQVSVDTEAPGLASFAQEEAPDTAPGQTSYASGRAEAAKPRSRFPSLAATAIVGGILGFGGTLALRHFEPAPIGEASSDERLGALTARLDALETKGGDAASASPAALAALEARVAAAEAAANKAAESANAAQASLQGEFATRPAGQEPGPGATSPESPDLGPLNERISSIEQKLASLEQSHGSLEQAHSTLEQKHAKLASAVTAPKAELRARQQEPENPAAKQASRAQAIAIVAQGLLHKVESGGQFSDDLTALENLGVPADSLAPLRAVAASAIPSERQLTKQFAALAPAIIASDPAKQGSAGEGFLDRVTRHAKDLVHVRRVGETEGADVEGLVSRIEKSLADHDLAAAYQVWKELPSAAVTKSQSWGDAAKVRLDAINAARSIEADAVAILGKSKS